METLKLYLPRLKCLRTPKRFTPMEKPRCFPEHETLVFSIGDRRGSKIEEALTIQTRKLLHRKSTKLLKTPLLLITIG